jgi:hypothetical protein
MLSTGVWLLAALILLTQVNCKHRSGETGANAPQIAAGTPVSSLADGIAKSTVSLNNAAGESFCSGTLISPTVVVTASHCVSTPQAKMPIFVAFGLDVRGQKSESPLSRAIIGVVVHPDYRPIDPPPFGPIYRPDDVALVKLDAAAPAGFSAVPVASEDWAFRSNPAVEIAGYGLTKDFIDAEGKNVSSNDTGILRRADGIIADSERWSTRAGMVAFRGENKKNSCRGDSGGPMFGTGNNGLLLLGATMGGGECANPDSTESQSEGLYTNLTTRREWIRCVSGVDTGSATDAGQWNAQRCVTNRKRACAQMKVGSASILHLSLGRGGLRFNAGREVTAGTPVEVQQWMGSWVRFSAPAAQIGVGFAPVESLVEDGSCKEVAEGTMLKVLKNTIFKSMPVQGVTLPSSMKCPIPVNALLDAAVVRFPTEPGATAQHLIVTLKKQLPNCAVITGFIPQNDVEPEFAMP